MMTCCGSPAVEELAKFVNFRHAADEEGALVAYV
jgi:hypothetical protein